MPTKPAPLAAPERTPSQPSRCPIKAIADRLSPADQDTLAAWMEVPVGPDALPGKEIARLLVAQGHAIDWQAVNKHRSGFCACLKRPDGWKRGIR